MGDNVKQATCLRQTSSHFNCTNESFNHTLLVCASFLYSFHLSALIAGGTIRSIPAAEAVHYHRHRLVYVWLALYRCHQAEGATVTADQ